MKSIDLLNAFKRSGIDLVTGVPDSLQKEFCSLVSSEASMVKHVAATNEGSAIGLAIGHHMATGSASLVYMQNSGLGNAFNPLISLAHSAIYKIPMILMIGWRGMPGRNDEPQHQTQGAATVAMLNLLGIPYLTIMSKTPIVSIEQFIATHVKNNTGPIAILVTPDTFEAVVGMSLAIDKSLMTREGAVDTILEKANERCIFVATTGKLSRELNEVREKQKIANRDFMTVGGMGHASAIALGIAIQRPDTTVVCLDGDGAALMHLGAMAMVGELKPLNFVHILFNNGVHESVGGQPIASNLTTFTDIALSLKYETSLTINTQQELDQFIADIDKYEKPCFAEVLINTYSRENLTRPKHTPAQNKKEFMKYISRVNQE